MVDKLLGQARSMPDRPKKLPNFLVIGAAKSGTYTLNRHFDTHPQVCMCRIKEPHFFAFGGPSNAVNSAAGQPVHAWVESEEDYLRLFSPKSDELMVGECSVSYLYWPGTAERIHEFNPDMKLIVSLRNPVDRAYSSFNYAKSYGIEPLPTLAEGLEAEQERIRQNQSILLRYRDLGLYAKQLKRYFAVFPRAQIKIILHDDLLADPVGTVRSLYEFIGVEPDVELDPTVRVNVTKLPDDSNPLHQLFNSENWARTTARKVLPMPARQGIRNVVRHLFFKRPPKLDRQLRSHLQALFRDDILEVEKLVQRDLSAWLA